MGVSTRNRVLNRLKNTKYYVDLYVFIDFARLVVNFFSFFFRIWYQMQRYNTGDSYDPDHQNKVAMNQNMSTLEQDLKKQILGRSKAEKVFRPWWDTVEDYLLNCLVLLGKKYLCFAYNPRLYDRRRKFTYKVFDMAIKKKLPNPKLGEKKVFIMFSNCHQSFSSSQDMAHILH